jgi:hypothetical protein
LIKVSNSAFVFILHVPPCLALVHIFFWEPFFQKPTGDFVLLLTWSMFHSRTLHSERFFTGDFNF